MPDLHIAVDTGGTFTDIGVRRADGSLAVWKVPSTPHAPDEAVITGITGALEREDAQPAQDATGARDDGGDEHGAHPHRRASAC